MSVYDGGLAEVLVSLASTEAQTYVHATTLSIAEAKKGFLRKRGDLLARAETLTLSRLLVVVTVPAPTQKESKEFSCQIRVLMLSSRPQSQLHRSTYALDVLHALDVRVAQLQRPIGYCLHSSGQLLVWNQRRVAVLELAGVSTTQKSDIEHGLNIDSLLRLSSETIAVSNHSSVVLVDIKHSAIASTIALGSDPVPTEEAGVRSQGIIGITRLLAFFPSLTMLILLRGRSLFTVNLGGSNSRQIRHPTLADAIGRGLRTNQRKSLHSKDQPGILGEVHLGNVEMSAWSTAAIDRLATAKTAEDVDNSSADLLSDLLGELKMPMNASNETRLSPLQLARYAVSLSHVLSNIFVIEESSGRQRSFKNLSIRLLPPQTFEWLVGQRLITQYRVEQALRQTDRLSTTDALHPCAVVEALAKFDYSLQTVLFLLASSTPLTAREAACGVRYALAVIQQSENLSNLKLITDTAMTIDSKSDDGVDQTGDHSPEPERNADRIHDAHAVMRISLTRLSICHDSDIREAVARELPTAQLLLLVDYLRAEIAGGGWLSSYAQSVPLSEDVGQANGEDVPIVRILNCAVDALGTGAWLNATMSDEHAEKIAWMKAETSAALEGIEEAVYLQGLLHEALLYAKRAPPPAKIQTEMQLPINSSGVAMSKPIKILSEKDETNALPMGLRPPDHVETKVFKDGKEVQRSKRDIGRLKSELVGAYSIERITI